MSDIVRVLFDGDELEANREDSRAWVVVRRVSEVLGIDHDGQRRKLNALPWATTEIISAVADDGKVREHFCLDLDCLPMWLATISPGKIRAELRPKLIRYQRECARVLRDHFFGRPAPSFDAELVAKVIGQAMAQALPVALAPILAPIVDAIGRISDRVDAIERRDSAYAEPIKVRRLKADLSQIARTRAAYRLNPSARSARTWLENKLRKTLGWFGTGRSWDRLPAHRMGDAETEVEALRRDTATALETMATARQEALPFSSATKEPERH